MAAPAANKIILPDDATNVGKKIRTQTKVIGADTVHEYFDVHVRQAVVLGVYRLGIAQQTILASAQAAGVGFVYAHVPTSVTGKSCRIRTIRTDSQHSSALATPTAPRLSFIRCTHTGTASGASGGTPVKLDTGVVASVLDFRTAMTGLTITEVGSLGVVGLTGALTAVGAYAPAAIHWGDNDEEDEWTILAPGQGLLVRQDVGGTTTDTRKINMTFVFDDIDTA